MRLRSVRLTGSGRPGARAARARRTAAGVVALALPLLTGAVLTPPAQALPTPSGPAVTSTIPVGARPGGVAVDPASGTVYVADFGGDSVSVIDERTSAVTRTIPVGASPYGVAVDSVSGTVYVGNEGSGTVSVIDETTGTVTRTIPVGTNPYAVAADPVSHTVYVTNYTSSSVSVIDETTGTVTRTVPVGDLPSGVAVDPASSTVYVTNWTSGTMSVIDEGTGLVTGTIPVGNYPFGVAVDPATGTVYVANQFDGIVTVVDGKTGTVTGTIPTGGIPCAVAFDEVSGTAYVALQGDNAVSVIDEKTGTVTATVEVGQDPLGVAVDPVSSNAYVTNVDDDSVSAISAHPAPMAAGISGTPPTPATVGTAYSSSYTLTGIPTPTTSVTQGRLPDGLTLSAGGKLTGTPTAGGSYTFTVTATNGVGSDATTQSTIVVDTVPAFTRASPATTAGKGIPYTASFAATATPAPTYALAPGSASFLSMNSTTGRVSGTPAATGRFSYAVIATNRAGSAPTPPFTVTAVGPWDAGIQGFVTPPAGSAAGFTLGVTNGNTWSVAVRQPTRTKTVYAARITLDRGTFTRVSGIQLEAGDTYTVNGNTLTFRCTDLGDLDGLTFTTPLTASAITLSLSIAGTPATPGQVLEGQGHTPSATGSPVTFRRSTS